MGRRKGRSEKSETLISGREGRGEEGSERPSPGEEKGGFFACYLLASLSPRHKGHTYIGFTVNPRRRIRQHNGEIGSGAWRTKKKRPWEMVMCIYGFPTNVSALQFEWAWQHPTESLAVRTAAATFKSLSGLANKIKLGYTMLTIPAWQNLHLTVNFLSTKYTQHSAGCPSLPEHMKVQVCSMDELPCYTNTSSDHRDDDNEICNKTSSDGSVSEGLIDMTVDYRRDYWKSNEEMTTHGLNGCVEDISTRQLLSSTEDHRQSFLSPSFLTSTFNTLEAVKDRDVFAFTEESSKVELDQPSSEELPTRRAANNDQPPINGPVAPSEVEVIDLLSPSPGYRIRSTSKKRKVPYVRSEIIDLTKSPIFV
ncbi:Structure-specific endonuclease subunit SLX1 [Camellia lanceoleosa]|uniref:Structure-specific endonuclease subunit SLX1 n=1 Tax=Camellia lanceoleosa TaxID=1840588 RepID=A0ACC0F2Y6_9ERIC|nr:Structure-specific endonuclease subunit SLX1 [Camellia lanceoleosa]